MRPADVVVIGGGVIGSAVAYYAARRGLKVTLVDPPKRGRATSASAGGLWSIGESVGLGCGVIFHKAQAAQGLAPRGHEFPGALPSCFFDFAMRSNRLFPGLVQELGELSGVDVEWERISLLFVLYNDGDQAFADFVHDRLPGANRLMQSLSNEELARDEPFVTRENQGAVRFLSDDQINPYRLADAFVASARKLGAQVVSRVEVTGIATRSGKVQGVETSAGPIPGEIIIGSTTEEVGFDPSITPDALQDLAAGAIRALPFLETRLLKRTWSGLRPGTPDELPILGPVPELAGYYNACGHFRTGILNAPLTGMVIAEMVARDEPSLDIEPYLLARFVS